MIKKITPLILVLILGVAIGWLLKTSSLNNSPSQNKTSPTSVHENEGNLESKYAKPRTDVEITEGLPPKVFEVLNYINEHQVAPEGYVGGRRFKNFENLLPKFSKENKKISYKEWDVNPKKQGKNRGTERLVTGDDGSAYYTNDHYNSFKKIQ